MDTTRLFGRTFCILFCMHKIHYSVCILPHTYLHCMYSVVPSNDVSAVSASDGSSGAFIVGLSGFASDLELSMNKAFSFIFPFLMIFF